MPEDGDDDDYANDYGDDQSHQGVAGNRDDDDDEKVGCNSG